MDEVKTQLNKYFIYLAENHTTSHVLVHVPCEYMGDDNNIVGRNLMSFYEF